MIRKATTRQKLFAFDGSKEQRRQERVERLLRIAPERITTGAKWFDYLEASKIAQGER